MKKFICLLIGHDWSPHWRNRGYKPTTYHWGCNRCLSAEQHIDDNKLGDVVLGNYKPLRPSKNGLVQQFLNWIMGG